jgi:hypothetical protein
MDETERLSPSVLSPGDSNKEETPYVTPGKALKLGEEDRRKIGWQSPPSDTSEERRARERRSKSNQDRPSKILAKELAFATQLQFEPDVEVKEGSPSALGLHQAPAIQDNSSVLPLADEDPIPALGALVTRAPRSKSATPSEAQRKSARGSGLTEGSVLDRAMRLANDKDAPSSSTPGTHPTSSPSLSAFTAFQDMPAQKLLKVAQDSCVIFPSAAGAPEEIISLIQAKELAQADLAAARFRAELEAAKEKEAQERRAAPTQEGPVLEENGATVPVPDPASAPKKKTRVYKKKQQPIVGSRPLTRRARALSIVSQ